MSRLSPEEQQRRRNAKNASKFSKDIVGKLESVFSLGGNVTQACSYAGISRDTYYEWIKSRPALSDRFERMRAKPQLVALQALNDGLKDPDRAFRYLSKTMPEELGDKLKLEHSGEVKTESVDRDNPLVRAVVGKFESELKQAIVDSHKKPTPAP